MEFNMGISNAVHYERWRPAEARGKAVWVRYKDGDESARPILLTPGIITSGPQLNPLCDELGSYEGKVLAIEPPGQGRSDRIGKRRSVDDYAREIRDISLPFIGNAGLANSVLVGHCFGADVMHALAKQEPVAATVLLNPLPDNSITSILKFNLRFNRKTVESFFRKYVLGNVMPDNDSHLKDVIDPGQTNSSMLRRLRSMIDAVFVWKSREFSTQAGSSTVVLVTGRYDVQVRPGELQEVSGRIANSRVVVIEDSGHMTNLTRPDKVAEIAVGLAVG